MVADDEHIEQLRILKLELEKENERFKEALDRNADFYTLKKIRTAIRTIREKIQKLTESGTRLILIPLFFFF